MGEIESRVWGCAAARHGVITRDELREFGVDPRIWSRRVVSGQWVKVLPGVWRSAEAPVTWRQSLCAGLAWLGDGATVSHFAAAALHGLEGFDQGPTEFTTAVRRSSRPPFMVHYGRVNAIDRAHADGLPVTSATRTILDLAATGLAQRRLERAIDSATHAGLTSTAFLSRRLNEAWRGGHRRGSGSVLALLPASGGHSALERRFLRLVRDHGLPAPACQVVHGTARVDFDWSPLRVIVEVNGRRGHASDAERDKDARRRNDLQARGFAVLEFTYRRVADDARGVAEEVRHHLVLSTSASGQP